MLHELQSPDAAVFEYWNHATSFLPTCDYRFSLPLMRKYRTELHWSDPSPELEKAIKRMASLIRKKGPLMIRDVESAGSVRQWSKANLGKIERRALHELWIRGEIMIRSRHGFKKFLISRAASCLKRPTLTCLPIEMQRTFMCGADCEL